MTLQTHKAQPRRRKQKINEDNLRVNKLSRHGHVGVAAPRETCGHRQETVSAEREEKTQ